MRTQKTALVAGGAGFIGSHLCEKLLSENYRVICLDNLITSSEANIRHLQVNHDFSFIKHDVSLPYETAEHIDLIFHLASPASVPDYQNHPEETALANSIGTLNLLRLAKSKSAAFLFTSTSEVYGDPKVHPQNENYWGNVNPNGVRACYDESKRFGEAMTMLYFRNHNLNTRIIRIFNTYGPRMRKNDGRVISNFINQALENRPLTVYGDGQQTRSFCYVKDMTDGIFLAMTRAGTAGEVINLGNPEEYKMLDLARKIKDLISTQSAIEYHALPVDDPTRRKPDISKAKKLLGWSPDFDLNAGLEKTIDYYRQI